MDKNRPSPTHPEVKRFFFFFSGFLVADCENQKNNKTKQNKKMEE
jgi:hypothetical protein